MRILTQLTFFYKCLLLNKVLFMYLYNYSQYTCLLFRFLRHFAIDQVAITVSLDS